MKNKMPKKNKNKLKELPDASVGDGDFDAGTDNRKMEAHCRTAIGADGVIEHHVSLSDRKQIIQINPLGDAYDLIDWGE